MSRNMNLSPLAEVTADLKEACHLTRNTGWKLVLVNERWLDWIGHIYILSQLYSCQEKFLGYADFNWQ